MAFRQFGRRNSQEIYPSQLPIPRLTSYPCRSYMQESKPPNMKFESVTSFQSRKIQLPTSPDASSIRHRNISQSSQAGVPSIRKRCGTLKPCASLACGLLTNCADDEDARLVGACMTWGHRLHQVLAAGPNPLDVLPELSSEVEGSTFRLGPAVIGAMACTTKTRGHI